MVVDLRRVCSPTLDVDIDRKAAKQRDLCRDFDAGDEFLMLREQKRYVQEEVGIAGMCESSRMVEL